MFTRLLFWLKAVLHRDALETRMDEEMRLHVELHTGNLVRAGVALDEARRRALAEFGGIEAAKDHCRDARGVKPDSRYSEGPALRRQDAGEVACVRAMNDWRRTTELLRGTRCYL